MPLPAEGIIEVEVVPLTIGEEVEARRLAGLEDWQDYERTRVAGPAVRRALIYLYLRRKYPDVTLEDVDRLTYDRLQLGGPVEPNPTGARS